MKYFSSFFAISLILFISNTASAEYFFDDDTIYWELNGYKYDSHNDSVKYNGEIQDKTDAWGIPNITGGSFSYSGHYLSQIYLNYEYSGTQGWDTFEPMDWFFDIDSDGIWDYILESKNTRNHGMWDLHEVSISFSDENKYIFSSAPYGYTPRYDHPIAVKDSEIGDKVGSAYFDGWRNTKPEVEHSYEATWIFNTPLFLGNNGGQFTYGFTVSCANDVIYGKAPIPTPAPTTLLLLGFGLVGLGAVARKRINKPPPPP